MSSVDTVAGRGSQQLTRHEQNMDIALTYLCAAEAETQDPAEHGRLAGLIRIVGEAHAVAEEARARLQTESAVA